MSLDKPARDALRQRLAETGGNVLPASIVPVHVAPLLALLDAADREEALRAVLETVGEPDRGGERGHPHVGCAWCGRYDGSHWHDCALSAALKGNRP